jgi:hypothetical protein
VGHQPIATTCSRTSVLCTSQAAQLALQVAAAAPRVLHKAAASPQLVMLRIDESAMLPQGIWQAHCPCNCGVLGNQ